MKGDRVMYGQVNFCYRNGKKLMEDMKAYLISKGFNKQTLEMLNFHNLSKLAADYQFRK